MKKSILLIALCALCSLSAMAQDWSKVGLKGKVIASTVTQDGDVMSYANFTSYGSLTGLALETGFNCNISISDMSKTSSAIQGYYDGYRATATVSNGKISKLTYTDDNYYDYVVTFQYNSNGFLSKVSETRSWTSTENVFIPAKVPDYYAIAHKYEKLMKSALSKGNMVKYYKYYNLYAEALNNASSGAVPGRHKTVTKKHSESQSSTYYSYVTDEFGNWTSRIACTNGNEHQQVQSITYESNYISEYMWDKVSKTGDLQQIHRFATNDDYSDSYRAKAVNYWNDNILAEVERKYNNDSHQLCLVAADQIASSDVKSKALNIARNKIYVEGVLPETDYQKVEDLANLNVDNFQIFDEEYRNRILQRSAQLKSDSIANVTRKAQNAMTTGDYTHALSNSLLGLAMDNGNNTLENLRSESEYMLLQRKIANNSQTEDDYLEFISANPNSSHVASVQDARVQYALDKAGDKPSYSEIEAIQGYNMSKEMRKKVDHVYKHRTYQLNHGPFFNMGIGGHFEWGPGLATYGGGIDMRFGYMCNFVNVGIGAEYEILDNPKIGQKASKDGAYLTGQRIACPVMLRLNVHHSYTSATYIGLGATIGIPVNTKFVYDDGSGSNKRTSNDKNMQKKAPQFSPRAALGFCSNNVEFEIYGVYEMKSLFDTDYVNSLLNYQDDIDGCPFDYETIDKQLNKKWRVGVALRYLF